MQTLIVCDPSPPASAPSPALCLVPSPRYATLPPPLLPPLLVCLPCCPFCLCLQAVMDSDADGYVTLCPICLGPQAMMHS